jgi:hypothetical protein
VSTLERLAPLSGVLVVVLTVAALIIIGEQPDFVDEPDAVAEFYADDPGKLLGGFYVDALASLLVIWFAGSVRSALRVAEGGDGRLSAVSFGGGVAAAVLFLAYDAVNLAAAFRADEDGAIDPAVAASLNDVSGLMLAGGAMASAVFIGAAALVALRRRAVLPAWFAWISIPLAILLVSPFGYIGLFGLLPWILIASIVLYIGQRRAAPAAPAAPTPLGPAGPPAA